MLDFCSAVLGAHIHRILTRDRGQQKLARKLRQRPHNPRRAHHKDHQDRDEFWNDPPSSLSQSHNIFQDHPKERRRCRRHHRRERQHQQQRQRPLPQVQEQSCTHGEVFLSHIIEVIRLIRSQDARGLGSPLRRFRARRRRGQALGGSPDRKDCARWLA